MKIYLTDGKAEINEPIAPFKYFVVSIEPAIETPINICFGKTSCSFLIKDSVQIDFGFDSQVDSLSINTDKLIKEVTINFFENEFIENEFIEGL
jgi:hypothetical protein